MKISSQQYALSLYESASGHSGAKLKGILASFVAMVYRHGDAKKFPEIINLFSNIWNKENGLIEAELISARHLAPEAKELVVDYLKDRTSAQKISLTEKTEPNLLGGFILKYGSRVLDGSLKNTLANLRDKISN